MSIEITNNDLGSVVLRDAEYRDELLTFGGENIFAEGTILARRAVAATPVAAADGGNTGDGTVTALSVVEGPVVPLVGAYVLTCVATETNGGTFKLVDPNGALLTADLKMVAGAGDPTTFEVAGLQFTITDGSTDFAADDEFTITVAAGGKLEPFAIGGAAGLQTPIAVLPYEVARTTAGDTPVRALVRGVVNKNRLIVDADGDGSNLTNAILDDLRRVGITPIDVQQLAAQDNQ